MARKVGGNPQPQELSRPVANEGQAAKHVVRKFSWWHCDSSFWVMSKCWADWTGSVYLFCLDTCTINL